MFTMNIDLWCFSFVTLFNLQGTRPVRLSGGTYSILPRRSAFVKHFFQLFRSFFGACRSFSPLSQTAHLFYQSRSSLSSSFFASFEVFSLSTSAFPPFFRQLKYFTKAFLNCQELFSSLKTFLLSTLARPPRFRQLAYLTRFFPFCQHLFTYFRFFFSSSIYANTTASSKTVPNETPVSRWIPRSGRLAICLYVRSGRQQISPAALVAFRSISRWLRLPRNLREISFCSSTNRPSTKTSNSARISSVTSHRG